MGKAGNTTKKGYPVKRDYQYSSYTNQISKTCKTSKWVKLTDGEKSINRRKETVRHERK